MAETRKQPQQKKPVVNVKQQQASTVKQQQVSTAKQQPVITKKPVTASPVLFSKENYVWMGIGGVIVLLGMLLMSGGKSQNPNVFDYNEVYSFTRITLAPILIIAGLMVEIYAIFKKTKESPNV